MFTSPEDTSLSFSEILVKIHTKAHPSADVILNIEHCHCRVMQCSAGRRGIESDGSIAELWPTQL